MSARQWIHKWFLRHVPSRFYLALGALYYRLRGARKGNDNPPAHLSFVYGYDPEFDQVGEEFLEHFKLLAHLQPDHRVLDVGCGIGRCALPLTGFLSADGSYAGFDIRRDGIEWCQQHIATQFPNFRFQHVDLANATYHPRGGGQAEQACFPYEDGQFDLVFSKSVFTHLQAPIIAHYLNETHRVLKPGGYSLHTFFLLNEASREAQKQGISQFDFCYPIDHGAAVSASEPEKATAFEESHIRHLYDCAGLQIVEPIHYGKWSGRSDGLSGQDMIVAQRPCRANSAAI